MAEHREIPLFPLNTVLFPGMSLSLHIFEERYKLMIANCIKNAQPFGVVLIRTGEEVGDNEVLLHSIGTTAHITQVERLPEGRMNIATLGYRRFKVKEVRQDKPYLVGVIEDYPLDSSDSPAARQLATSVSPMLHRYLEFFAALGNVELEMETLPDDPVTLAFLTAIILRTPMKDKQDLLNVPDVLTLLRHERRILHREAQLLKLLVENGMAHRDDLKPFSLN